MNNDRADRYAVSVAILAGSLATATVYFLSDYVRIEQTVLVASVPVIAAALVSVGAVLYWQVDRSGVDN